MLKAIKVPFKLWLGRWFCTCLRDGDLDDEARGRIRPTVIGWFACWCDRT